MSRTNPTAGECPDCGGAIGPARTLIQYEGADGSPRRFAECPSCNDVVKPVDDA